MGLSLIGGYMGISTGISLRDKKTEEQTREETRGQIRERVKGLSEIVESARGRLNTQTQYYDRFTQTQFRQSLENIGYTSSILLENDEERRKALTEGFLYHLQDQASFNEQILQKADSGEAIQTYKAMGLEWTPGKWAKKEEK